MIIFITKRLQDHSSGLERWSEDLNMTKGIEELCQPTLNGRGGPIPPVAIQANDFGLKHRMIQQVQNSCQFHGLPGDDASKNLDKFLHITQSMKQNGVTDDAMRLYLFPCSLTHHATTWKLHFNLSFADALLHMPKFATIFNNLLNNKEKLFGLATTLMNEKCSVVILKKLLEKLRDPGKFLIPCDFPELVECLAFADLGASINLMHLSIGEKLSLPELTPTQMILELADRSTTRPAGIVEDVFVKVGKFHFSTNFVVVDYVIDPRVPLIIGIPFLRTGRALIDVYCEELTLQVDDEAITFKVGLTLSFSYNDAKSINRIDVIDVACKDYAKEVLGFLEISTSGNPTSKPIISTSSPTLTPFGDSDFLLEETDAFLAIEDDSISPEINDSYYDSEGDIRLFKEFLNDDPSSPLPPKELKLVEPKTEKSSIDEPPELEFKDLPSHFDPWVSPIHYVPKKGGMTIMTNDDNELIPTRLVTRWRVCIDSRKLNDATWKDHFPLPFMDQMLE
nr:reverse transcriptase domain-containing protein [Tanacetum cinerariifolium]